MTGRAFVLALSAAVVCGSLTSCTTPDARHVPGKIPISTSSTKALRAYLKGRDLYEKLRATDGREYFAAAAEADPAFALAHLGLANTAPTAADFFIHLGRAVALAGRVSEGEAHLIKALEASVNSNPEAQLEHLTALVRLFPNDERAHSVLGNLYFGRQEWEKAIAQYRLAVKIAPQFSPPYNQLGYAFRFLGRYPEAEGAFKRYVSLLPDEPNPYDSYAELLMKTGRFEESIDNYEKALDINPNFVQSYVGMGNDLIFLGRPKEARNSFTKLAFIARNDGEKRQAIFWTAISYLHEGDHARALAETERLQAIARATDDRVAMSGDLNTMANILLAAGNAAAAGEKFDAAVEMIGSAVATAQVKETVRRNHLFNTARVLLAKGDVAGAGRLATEYAAHVAVHKIPFELWQSHQLLGLVALATHRNDEAVRELRQANPQDPQVLYELGEALEASGDPGAARQAYEQAADFNGLSFTYPFVRGKALAKLKQ